MVLTPLVLLAGLAALAGMLATASRNLLHEAARSVTLRIVSQPEASPMPAQQAVPVVELRPRPRERFRPASQDLTTVSGAELGLSRAA